MNKTIKNIIALKTIIIFLFCSFILFISAHEGMFWDNVLFASQMGNQLYKHGIFDWYIPNSFDPGHPPFLGFLLAISWKLISYNLFVSHAIMMPFVFGVVWQLHNLCFNVLKQNKPAIAATVLIMADPTLCAQFVLVNMEVIQLFFFLLAVNGILKKNAWLQTTGLFFLGIVSLRGMMLCGGIFLFDLCYSTLINKHTIRLFFIKKKLAVYSIGSIPACAFLLWHFYAKGWIIQMQPNSPWASYADIVNVKGFLRNIVVLCQRYGDFGRCFIIIFIVTILFLNRKTLNGQREIFMLALLAVCSVFFIIVYSLFSTNAMAHRYFLPSFVIVILLAFFLMTTYLSKNKKLIYTLLLTGLLTGNMWVYPKKIAQGWDASLAHMPYFKLRQQAIEYLDAHNILLQNTGTFFPNIHPLNDITLNGDTRSFTVFNGNNDCVFYANVFNLRDDEYNMLQHKYVILKTFSEATVTVELLKRVH